VASQIGDNGNVPAPTTRTLGLGAAEVVAYRAILGREREIDMLTGGDIVDEMGMINHLPIPILCTIPKSRKSRH
jgi:hypothetical protein